MYLDTRFGIELISFKFLEFGFELFWNGFKDAEFSVFSSNASFWWDIRLYFISIAIYAGPFMHGQMNKDFSERDRHEPI
jgi:hypothetical protein